MEEQFYLLWPLVFAACMTRFGHRRLVVGVIAGAIASSLLMAILFDPVNPNRVFYGTDTRATPLLIGVALAFFWNPERLKAKTGTLAPAALDAIGAFALAMMLITFLTVHDYEKSLYHGGFLLLSLWTALLIAALAHPAADIGRIVGNPGMRWLGLRSYSFYLWHWPVLELTRPGIDVPLHGPVLLALQLGATLALADLSYRYVEQPFRRSTSWERPDWLRIGRVGIAVGVTAVVLVVGWSGIVPRGHHGQLRSPPRGSRRRSWLDLPFGRRVRCRGPRVAAPAKAGTRGSDALPVLALGDSVMVDARSGLARCWAGADAERRGRPASRARSSPCSTTTPRPARSPTTSSCSSATTARSTRMTWRSCTTPSGGSRTSTWSTSRCRGAGRARSIRPSPRPRTTGGRRSSSTGMGSPPRTAGSPPTAST